jgi:transcriptional regulator with XRE-family HTH domain
LPEHGHERGDLAFLGQAVRQMREQLNMSAEGLAEASGTTPRRVAALEAGSLDPTYALLVALADGLRTHPSSIVALAEQLRKPSGP